MYFSWFNGGCFHLPPRFGRGHDLTMNAVRIVMRLGFGGFCSHWNFERNDRGLHDCFLLRSLKASLLIIKPKTNAEGNVKCVWFDV